jgi:cytochrome c peroxidase
MKTFCLFLGVSVTVIFFSLTYPTPKNDIGVAHTLANFSEDAEEFSTQILSLKAAIAKLEENDPNSIVEAKKALTKSRLAYKRIEFFLHYFLPTTSIIYNAPPNYEVEVPFMEAREPLGLQVIEGYLFEDHPYKFKNELEEHIYLISASATDLNSLLFSLEINDQQILESIRLGIYNVMTLGITGFDAPELKTGIAESEEALKAFKVFLEPYVAQNKAQTKELQYYLDQSINFLHKHSDFDSFDRLSFLTDCAMPLQSNLNKLITSLNLSLSTTPINYNAENIFAKDAIRLNDNIGTNKEIVNLGKRLFFEKALSGNHTMNCGSCHNPNLYFTDQLPQSLSIDGKTRVSRNAPTLMYAALQYTQFWDGRAANLGDQIKEVLQNPHEMNSNLDTVVARLKANKEYFAAFKQAFPASNGITIDHLSHAISAYVKTLSPFNSAFDRYMQGNKKALNEPQKRGFNLFMGKAQCGTCHFAPIFNGLAPPFYDRTDLEILGTTANTNFTKPVLDADNGRYNTYPYIYFKGAFKTPTVRNAAKTAPYMHNGNFETLETVVNFYDNGGGAGMGLEIPLQTLSAKKIQLTDSEKKDLVKFIDALTDTKPK